MKKIDLHIHTVPTISDRKFEFNLDVFKRYVTDARLDAVAVTNHDIFNLSQFRVIQQSLDAIVFPGIEINLEKGHVLIIGSPQDLDDFDAKASLVTQRICKIGDNISVADLASIYGDLSKYLVIPHYDKGPPIAGATLDKLRPFVCAGEVDSAKKFVRAIKDSSKLSPVLFSDSRMRTDLDLLPTRQTYVDCGEVTISALNASLRDKAKVALSESDGNKLWQVFEDGQQLSTGLNVLLGARSSGKTHTLNEISKSISGARYIKQFSLVQQNDAAYEREFTGNVERKRSTYSDEYLSGLKRVVDDLLKVDWARDKLDVEKYITTILKAAEESDRHDAFSKAVLFSEEEFTVGSTGTLKALIESVRQVIENGEFRSIIEKHLEASALRRLAIELIELLRTKHLDAKKRAFVNSVVKDVKEGLRIRTSATQVADVDLYHVCLDAKRIRRFNEIVSYLKTESVIYSESIRGFRIEAKREPFAGAGEIKAVSGLKSSFMDAFAKYASPYAYLQQLKSKEALSESDIYRLFIKITYRILNKDGCEVSGGERSEFRLLQEIADSQNYDVLLIDEPESSFDNLFLKSDVNQLLKFLSETMPVVVVTHNSTVGASVGADYLLCTKKEMEGGKPVYRIYSGYPTDRNLKSKDGREISSHGIVMDSLEAGPAAYEFRRHAYEAIKDQ